MTGLAYAMGDMGAAAGQGAGGGFAGQLEGQKGGKGMDHAAQVKLRRRRWKETRPQHRAGWGAGIRSGGYV